MSEQQNGFSRMNNVNHSGGSNRSTSGPARSESSAARRFSNIPLARKIEALILTAVTVIASMSVDWSSLTARAEDGYRGTLTTAVDLPSDTNSIVWTYTGRARGGSDNPYDVVQSAFMNISISGGTADYYVNIYQNYTGDDYTQAAVINNGKGISTDPIAKNQTTNGSFYSYSLWNYGDGELYNSPVILSQGEKVAVVVTFVKNSDSTVIQYGQGEDEDGNTVGIETNISKIEVFKDAALEGGTNPIVMTTDEGPVSFLDRFYLSPKYMRGVAYAVSDSAIASLNSDAQELTPQSSGETEMTVSADGADSLSVPVKVVSKGALSYEKTYDGKSFGGISPSCGGTPLNVDTDYVASYSGDYLQAGSAASDVINAGNYQVSVTGQGDYAGLSYTQNITIDPKNISDGNGGLNSQQGGIYLKTPAGIVVNTETSTVTSADNALLDEKTGRALSYGTDFTIGSVIRTSGLNNYSITFNGTGNYTGSVTMPVEATAYNTLTDISTLVQGIGFADQVNSPAAVDVTFDGKSHLPYVILYDQNNVELPLTAGTDYSYQIQNSDTGVTVYDSTDNSSTASKGVKEAGTYKVVITGLNSGGTGYTGSVDSSKLATPATFTVKSRTLLPGNFVLQLSPNTFFYNGTQDQHPTTVMAYYPYTDDDGNPQNWSMGADAFDIVYQTYSKGTSRYTVAVTGKGNFSGTVNFQDYDQAADATALSGHVADRIHYKSSVYYYIKDSLDEAVVTIGDNNAATTKTADWTRTAAAADFAPTYTGSQIAPSVTVKIGDQTLVKDTDYTVTYGRNIEAGDAYLTITGIGTTYGTEQHTMKVNFTIAPRFIDSDALKVTAKDRTYSGKAQPLISTEYYVLKDSANSASAHLTEASLTSAEQTQADAGTGADTIAKNHPNADFYLSYDSDKTNAGDVTVTAHGINNYTGTSSGSYKIDRLTMVDKKNNGNFSVDDIPAQTYTGSPVIPTDSAVTVRYKTKILTKGTDYTVSYSNNTELSTDAHPAEVKITGAGNYQGTITANFKIVPRSLSDGTFEYMIGTADWAPLNGNGKTNVSSLQLPYTGKLATGKLTIAIRSRTSATTVLKEGKNNDFTVDIPKDYSVGLHTIAVTGQGKYAGSTAKIAYRIVPSSLGAISNLRLVSVATSSSLDASSVLVTGKDIKRYYQVVYGTSGTPIPAVSGSSINYTYTWQTSDGTDAGTVPTTAGTGYKVVLTGSGNYTGSVTLDKSYATTSLSSSQQPLMVGASLDVNNIIKVYGAGGEVNGQHSLGYLGNNMPAADISGSNNAKLTDNTTLNSNIDGDTSLSTLSGPTYSAGTYDNTGATDYTVHFISTNGSTEYTTFMEPGTIFKVRVDAKEGSTKYFGSHTTSDTFKVTPGNLTALQKSSDDVKTQVTVKDTNTTNASKTSYVISGGNVDATDKGLSYEYTGGDIAPSLSVVIEPSYTGFNGSFYSIDLANYGKTQTPTSISGSAVTASDKTIKVSANTTYFKDSIDVPYAITAYTLQRGDISIDKLNLTYDGESHETEIRGAVHVKVNETELDTGDYTLSFHRKSDFSDTAITDFTSAGDIYVQVSIDSSKNKSVTGSNVKASGYFTIQAASISGANVILGTKTTSPNYAEEYTGNEIKPTVTVTLDGKSLTATTDYEVEYVNNKEIGVATVTVKGKGNYKDSITQQFYIYGSLKKATATGIKDNETYVIKSKGKPEDSKGNVIDYTDVSFKVGSKTLEKDTNYSVTVTHDDGTVAKYGLAEPGKYIITYTGLGIDHYCDSDTSESVTYSVTIRGDIKNYATVSGYSSIYDYAGTKPYGPQNSKDIKIKLTGGYRVPTDAYTITPNANERNKPSSEKNMQPHFTIKIADSYKDYYIADTGDTLDVSFAIKYNLQKATIKLKAGEEAPVYGEGEDDVDELKEKIEVTYPGITGTLPTEAYQVTGAVWKSVGSSNKAQLQITIGPDEGEVLSYNAQHTTIGGSWKQFGDIMVSGETSKEYANTDYYSDFKGCITVNAADGTPLSEGADYTVQFRKADSNGKYSATGTVDSQVRKAGKYYAEIKGLGAYHTDKPIVLKEAAQEFIVNPKNISTSTMDLVDKNVKYYSGADPEAQYTVTDTELNAVLKENTDYTIAHTETAPAGGNLWDVGTVITYTVTGTGNYTGTNTATVTIEAADLNANGVIDVQNDSIEYDGQPHGPEFKVYRGKTPLTEGVDYDIDSKNTSVNVGKYTYTITGKDHYTGSKTIDFSITPRDLSKATIKLTKKEYDWSGTPITPTDYTISDSAVSGSTIVTDTAVSYVNNTASYKYVNDSETDANAPAIVFTASGNYTGTVTRHFQIGSDIADATVELDKEERDFDSKTPFYPAVESVSVTNGPKYDSTSTPKVSEVAENPTYEFYNSSTNEWTAVTQPLAAGTYRAVVAGKGPFFGTNSKAEFTIIPNSVSSRDLQVTIKKDTKSGQHYDSGKDIYYYYYTGEEIKPDVVVKYKNPDTGKLYTLNPSDSDEDITGDYYLTYEDNIRVGTAAVVVHLHNNYESDGGADGDASFEIRARDVSKYKVRVKGGDVAYTGDELKPDYIVTASDGTKYDSSNESDAEVLDALGLTAEYTNNVGPGTGNITITGSGNSSGTTATATFTIYADISKDVDYITPKDVFRTGSSLSPDITLHIVDNAGTDHPVASSSNWFRTTFTPEDGTWATATKLTVSVSHRGNYLIGRKNFTVNLSAVPPNLTIDGYQPTYQYTGTKINPSGLTVKSDGEALPSGATVSFSFNSARDGSACVLPGKVTITATVSYGGQSATVTAGKYSTEDNEKPATFTIVPRPIKACVFQGPSDSRYTGSAISPIFSINTGYAQLRNGTDYTYTVRNNVKPGNAIVTITGRGNYIGTTTKAFHIYVAPVTGLSTSNKSGTTAVVRWRRSGTADGYRVTYTSSTGVRKMLITSPTASNYKLTDLKSGTTQVLVEAYVSSASGRPMAYSAPASVTVR